jgi:hypothetical protein
MISQPKSRRWQAEINNLSNYFGGEIVSAFFVF